MHEDVKNTWVAALRSGRFAQGTGYLAQHTEPGQPKQYCCLGVLMELAIDAGLGIKRECCGPAVLYGDRTGDCNAALIPSVREWSGVRFCDGLFGEHPNGSSVLVMGSKSLSDLNDSGKSFGTIADAIEANWESL